MAAQSSPRLYLQSHPWITFQFDTRKLDHRIWLLLGEAKSKCEHIMGAPLLPKTVEKMYLVYLAKGVLATTAIEGNTLTEEEVEKRIKGDLKLPPSKEYLGKEIDNVVNAINKIGQRLLVDNDSDKLSMKNLNDYNKMILEGLPLEEGVIPGVIRTYPVRVGRYQAVPNEDCKYLTERYISWLNDEFVLPKESKFILGILKAIIAHLYFVWIHPYGDGNGRTARLIEFQILLSIGAPPVAAHLLSNHYNLTRTEYYRHLDQASKSDEGLTEFIYYALQGFVDGLREEIESIQAQQLIVHWINHIYNTFKGKKSKTEERQKELLLEVSNQFVNGFTFAEVRHATPKIAEMYSQVADLTIKRDLQDLLDMQLLKEKNKVFKCNYSLLNVYKIKARE